MYGADGRMPYGVMCSIWTYYLALWRQPSIKEITTNLKNGELREIYRIQILGRKTWSTVPESTMMALKQSFKSFQLVANASTCITIKGEACSSLNTSKIRR